MRATQTLGSDIRFMQTFERGRSEKVYLVKSMTGKNRPHQLAFSLHDFERQVMSF